MTGAGKVHADIAALKAFREALDRFRYAQRDVATRGDLEIEKTRASLEAKASRWRSRLEQRRADLEHCRRRAAAAARHGGPGGYGGYGGYVDCSGYARAVQEAEERLENIRRWQQRVEQQADAFRGVANRFHHLLDDDLPHTRDHLAALIDSLEEARGLKVPRT